MSNLFFFSLAHTNRRLPPELYIQGEVHTTPDNECRERSATQHRGRQWMAHIEDKGQEKKEAKPDLVDQGPRQTELALQAMFELGEHPKE
jgi:hypothetical protein